MRQPSATSGKRTALTALGAVLLVAVTAGATLLIERRSHGGGDHDEHGHGHAAEGAGKGANAAEDGDHAAEAKPGEPRRLRMSEELVHNAALEMGVAAPGRVAVTLELPGEVALNAERLAHVTPRIGGTVRAVNGQLGDKVHKGDVLATLDSKELAEMQRDVLATKERLSLAEQSFQRAESLWKEKISAEKDYLAAKNALAEAQIEHRSATQKLGAAAGTGARGTGLALIAPLDGTIIEKHISIGEVLSDNTQAFDIADLSLLWVQVTVYSKDLSRVRAGQTARVVAEGIAEPMVGKIAYIDRVVGEETRTATARVELDDPGAAWRPGLFVTAEVAIEEVEAAVTVADEAVQRVDGKEVVFVRAADGFEVRPVVLGRRGLDSISGSKERSRVVEVLSGVASGERYAAHNSFVLKAELGKAEAGHDHAH